MSHSNRQSKFHSKLSAKVFEKSSLPQIDPLHLNNTNRGTNFAIKHPLKIVTEKEPNHLSFTKNHFRPKEIQFISHTDQNAKNQQHEQVSHQNKIVDKKSIEAEKQLMTADTVRPESQTEKTKGEDEGNVSGGFDMWNLNKNLKQFGETRKLAFYKNPVSSNKMQVIRRNRTQEIRSMYKIYGGGDMSKMNITERQRSQGHLNYRQLVEPFKKGKTHQKEVKSHSNVSNNKLISPLGNTLYGTLPVRKHNSNIEPTSSKKYSQKLHSNQDQTSHLPSPHLNPYLRTFINGSHLKRQSSNRSIHILEMNTLNTKQKTDDCNWNRNEKKQTNFRKNRFEMIQAESDRTGKDLSLFENGHLKSLDQELNIDQMVQDQGKEEDSILIEYQTIPNSLTTSLPEKFKFEVAKNTCNKKKNLQFSISIERIRNLMLKDSEEYLEQYFTFKSLPNSKIEFYIHSLNHPELANHMNEYKSSYHGEIFYENNEDFSFKEIRKLYENNQGNRQTSLNQNKKQMSKSKIK